MEIAYAEKRDRSAVGEIWLACFPDDSPETVDFFLDRLWNPGWCLVGRVQGRAVSMAFLLPAELVTEEGMLPLRYVFAAATLPVFQGRGYFGALLRRAHELVKADGVQATFLRPAEPGLAVYYERFGYRPYFTCVDETVDLPHPPALNRPCADRVREETAVRCRDAALEGRNAWVRWPAPVVELSAYGAGWLTDGGYAAGGPAETAVLGECSPAGEKQPGLFFREWIAKVGGEQAMLAAAARRYPQARSLRRRRPAREGEVPPPFGWLCPLSERAETLFCTADQDKPYMGPALD